MFRKLLQAMGRGLLEPGIIQHELRNTLGPEYAAELQALNDNRLRDEALKKRAAGIGMLGRAVVRTRSQFNDPERHAFFWREVAKPGIEVRFQASQSMAYDPARFYVDALDFAAAMTMLPEFMQGGQQSVAIGMVDTVQDLNARFQGSGGYFGHTPYWTLHDHQVWRGVDRQFSSVQVYWLLLLLADQLTAEVLRAWAQALLHSDVDEVKAMTMPQREQVFAQDLPMLASLLSLGAVMQAAANHSELPRAQALMQTISSASGDAMYVLHTLAQPSSMQSIQALKSLLEADHPLQALPDHHFSLALALQAGLMKPIAVIPALEDILRMAPSQDVITDARETVPHLLNASL